MDPLDSAADIGEKARGLSRIPEAWVPRFLVLNSEFHSTYRTCAPSKRKRLLDSWNEVVEKGLALAGIDGASKLYLRSNASGEHLAQRGLHKSVPTARNDWVRALGVLFDENDRSAVDIGVLIQEYVTPLASGHLSNERRVVPEFRDAEVELTLSATGEMREFALSFRKWRRSTRPSADALVCTDLRDLAGALREPLAFAAAGKARMNFEWVWDGRVVAIVQADRAYETKSGLSPEIREGKATSFGTPRLHAFHIATKADAKRSGKLRNHFLYADNGFRQPPLYVLASAAAMRGIMQGSISDELRSDLAELTRRPLVIRTSVAGGGTMLPRSDVLKSATQAETWLLETLRVEMQRRNVGADSVMLIAHHFIAANASAFATASPDKREVYIEALWGIPEGLYYYPCDAHLVDTMSPKSNELRQESFVHRKEIRFKEYFVAPDESGTFVVNETKRPWDWKETLGSSARVSEIAAFTRKLAGLEKKTIKLMWFVDCDASNGLPRLLPWFHDGEADDWSTAGGNYVRNRHDERISLHTLKDIEALEDRVLKANRPAPPRRLIVSIDPREHQIIRDEAIAERVGRAARELQAVVELQGGILSHLYYTLRRTGAELAVRNRPSFSIAPQSFYKLVRDNIPSVVVSAGETARISRLSPEALKSALKVKLIEEAFEVRDSSPADLVQELADVLEVVEALRREAGIKRAELVKVQRGKTARRGGFRQGIVLVDTALAQPAAETAQAIEGLNEVAPRVVETTGNVRIETAQAGPLDYREGDDFAELVQSSTVSLSSKQWTIKSPAKLRLRGKRAPASIEWAVEGQRVGGELRLRLVVRIGSRQYSLDLD